MPTSLNIFVIFILHSTLYYFAFGAECGDQTWSLYENEKCFKVVNQFVTKGEANDICRGLDEDHAEVLTIKNPSEQVFVTNLVFGIGQVFENFWIGAGRKSNGAYSWDKDDSPVLYTNWANGYPTPTGDGSDCVQLTSRVGQNDIGELNVNGLWKNVPCMKRNFVVCQKQAILSSWEMQDLLFNLKNNPVPIGFIYTQYPNKPAPQTIWPNLVWQDVSSQYAGVFFRALGGNSGSFGSVQAESTKRLKTVQTRWISGSGGRSWGSASVFPGQWSTWLTLGHHPDYDKQLTTHMRFEISNDEIRPRNMAIRVWHRIQ